jgi:two-component system response regulator DctR
MKSDRRKFKLTPRETEVARQVCAGNPSKLIAAALDISTRTVEMHLARIRKKTQCQTTLQTALFLQNFWSR